MNLWIPTVLPTAHISESSMRKKPLTTLRLESSLFFCFSLFHQSQTFGLSIEVRQKKTKEIYLDRNSFFRRLAKKNGSLGRTFGVVGDSPENALVDRFLARRRIRAGQSHRHLRTFSLVGISASSTFRAYSSSFDTPSKYFLRSSTFWIQDFWS